MRYLCLLMLFAFLLLAVPGGVRAAEQKPEEDAEFNFVALKLIRLAGRFGVEIDQNVKTAALATSFFNVDGMDELETGIDDVLLALEHSNVRENLGAPPEPTGDALFDRFAVELDRKLGEPSVEMQWAKLFTDSELADWEDEFGDDPRYWELRCLVVDTSELPDAERYQQCLELLAEARNRGIARPETELLYCKYLQLVHEEEMDDAGLAVELACKLEQEYEAAQLDVLDELVAAAPECAWAHYARAFYWFELGELERGFADLDTGNSAKYALYPLPFPFDAVVPGLAEEHPRGSAAVSGLVLVDASYLTNYIKLKEHIRSGLTAHALGGKDDWLNTWHEFACNMANAAPSRMLPSLIGIVCISLVAQHVEENYADQLSETQLITLNQMTAAGEAVRESIRGVSGTMPIENLLILSVIGEDKGAGVFLYLEAYYEYQVITTELLPIFADLKLVEYPELSTPPELMKYPIPPPEED
jgi:hypothetical protein